MQNEGILTWHSAGTLTRLDSERYGELHLRYQQEMLPFGSGLLPSQRPETEKRCRDRFGKMVVVVLRSSLSLTMVLSQVALLVLCWSPLTSTYPFFCEVRCKISWLSCQVFAWKETNKNVKLDIFNMNFELLYEITFTF